MDPNDGLLVFNYLKYCSDVVNGALRPLIYTHVILFFFVLLLIVYVYLHGVRKSPLISAFHTVSVSVIFWLILNFLNWIYYYNPTIVSATWAPIELCAVAAFVGIFLFIYRLFCNRGPNGILSVFLYGLWIPVVVLSPTDYNLTGYNYVECVAIENPVFVYYTLFVKMVLVIGTMVVIFRNWSTASIGTAEKRAILFGVVLFLFPFLLASYVSSVTANYLYDIYGQFGIILFFVSVTYLILGKKLFDVRSVGVQLLIGLILILNLPGVFFLDKPIDFVLWGLETLAIVVIGYFAVRSAQREHNLNEQLEVQNAELTAQKSQLEILNNDKAETLSLATHQLRAPLTGMKWLLPDLVKRDLGTEANSMIRQLYISAFSMLSTVETFLGASKIDQGILKLSKATTDVSALCTAKVAEYQVHASVKHIILSGGGPDASVPVTVFADEAKLKEVVSVLIDNAIKYTPEHGTVSVSFSCDDTHVSISVTDSGRGLEPGESDRLFQKGKRGSAQNENKGGSGFGLYFAQKIIQLHGGAITASSKGKNTGTTFTITLPKQ